MPPTYTTAARAAAVSAYLGRRSGETTGQIAQRHGVPRQTLLRWVAEVSPRGGEVVASEAPAKLGRPTGWQFSEQESLTLRHLRARHDSLDTAVRRFLDSPACRAETRAWLAGYLESAALRRGRHHWPSCLRRAAHLTEEDKDAFRGRKTLADRAASGERGLFWLDAQGVEHPLQANDIWESDDMSLNEPFTYIDPATGRTEVGRQVLFSQDVYSRQWLGFDMVGRERDAYRAEDITDHILGVIDAWGLPLVWRVERGAWENTALDGIALDNARARSLRFLGDRWAGRRIGGIRSLIHIEHTWSSRGKGGIENSFDHLQSLIAHESLHIGRKRGEFERAARQLRRAQDGQPDALAEFWPMEDAAQALCLACEEFNAQPKQRRAFGAERVVPAELWASRPVARPLDPADRWRFAPCQQLAVVQRGLIEVTDATYGATWRWMAGDLPHGYRVAIAFHPARPQDGCTLINAEFGPANREGLPIGTVLGLAPQVERAPQFDLRAAGTRGAGQMRGRQAAVRREARAIRDTPVPGLTREIAPQRGLSHLQDATGERVITVRHGGATDPAGDPPAHRAEAAPLPTAERQTTPDIASRRGTTPSQADLAKLEADAHALL